MLNNIQIQIMDSNFCLIKIKTGTKTLKEIIHIQY